MLLHRLSAMSERAPKLFKVSFQWFPLFSSRHDSLTPQKKKRRGILVIQVVQMQWQHSRILSIIYIYIYIFIFGEKVIIITSKTVQCTFTIQWILLFKSQWNVRQVIMNWYSVNWFFFGEKWECWGRWMEEETGGKLECRRNVPSGRQT